MPLRLPACPPLASHLQQCAAATSLYNYNVLFCVVVSNNGTTLRAQTMMATLATAKYTVYYVIVYYDPSAIFVEFQMHPSTYLKCCWLWSLQHAAAHTFYHLALSSLSQLCSQILLPSKMARYELSPSDREILSKHSHGYLASSTKQGRHRVRKKTFAEILKHTKGVLLARDRSKLKKVGHSQNVKGLLYSESPMTGNLRMVQEFGI
jgi:hypothetical protein